MKNPDFLSKNVDFIIQNVDFIIKHRWKASVNVSIKVDEFCIRNSMDFVWKMMDFAFKMMI